MHNSVLTDYTRVVKSTEKRLICDRKLFNHYGICQAATNLKTITTTDNVYTLSQKNIPYIFDCNLKTNNQILIIFGRNIPDTTCHQTIIQFPTSPNVCFCNTCGKHN